MDLFVETCVVVVVAEDVPFDFVHAAFESPITKDVLESRLISWEKK